MTLLTLAVDGRPETDAAIRWTAERAARDGSTVNVVAVARDDRAGRAAAESAAAAAAERIAHLQPSLVCATSVAIGDVVDQLLLVSVDSDLLVVGSNRPSPLAGLLHATLPMRLAGRAHCDLAVVPSGWTRSGGGGVVVGWSPDAAGAAALDRAAREAAAGGSALTIVHAWRPIAVSDYDVATGAALLAAIQEDAERALREAVALVRRDHPHLEIRSDLHLGSAVGGLTRRRDAALLVVGSHPHSVVGDVLLDPDGDALIREVADIPVLVTAGSPGGRDRVPEVSRQP